MKLHAEMINLARAADRRAHMRAEMARAGMTAEFHPAFDFKEHTLAEVHAYCRDEGPWGKFVHPHQACTISHSLAWERFLASDADLALIMEDDIHIAPETGAWLDDLTWWPEDADIVKLERWNDERVRVLLQEGGSTHRGRRIQKLLTRHMGAAGYIINRKAAKALLAAKPFDMVIDHILFNMTASKAAKALTIYQVSPALIRQGNEPPARVGYMQRHATHQGFKKFKQEIRRGLYEVALPLSTYGKLITGRAKFRPVPYAEQATPAQPN